MKKHVLVIFLTIVFSMEIQAHFGGHYQDGDQVVLNKWTTKTGKEIVGNFSYADNNSLFLEGADGRISSIPISSLTSQDIKLVVFKRSRMAKLNQAKQYTPTHKSSIANLSFYFISFLLLALLGLRAIKRKGILIHKIFNPQQPVQVSVVLFVAIASIYACKKALVPSIVDGSFIPKTRTSFLDSSFGVFKPSIETRSDATYYYIASTGIPEHNMMVGIKSWQQQVPIPQAYSGSNSWSIPLQPEYAGSPMSTKSNFMKGAVAIAVNGIPIFNALNNRGEDSYLIGELDNWGGHCGRADDYHYHAAPMHLSGKTGLMPIAFALDGFAVYGAKEPEGTEMAALDICHGHIGKKGVYHYHGTADYPYVIGAMKGKVNTDPLTPAPENQILPQAFAKPARPALTPLKDAVITVFKSNASNSYSLTYAIGSKFGYVNYSWDTFNKYTYTLMDIDGNSVTTTYQR
jgi:hypothetical protein